MLAVVDNVFPKRKFKPGEGSVGEVSRVCGIMDYSTTSV